MVAVDVGAAARSGFTAATIVGAIGEEYASAPPPFDTGKGDSAGGPLVEDGVERDDRLFLRLI